MSFLEKFRKEPEAAENIGNAWQEMADEVGEFEDNEEKNALLDFKRGLLLRTKTELETEGAEEVNKRIGFYDPTKGSNGLSDREVESRHERKILAMMAGKGFDKPLSAGVGAIESFAERYPTPIDFEEPSANLIRILENSGNSKKKIEEYETALHNLQIHIYGQRYTEWQKIKNATKEDLADYERPKEALRFYSNEEKREIIEDTEVDGNAWEMGGQELVLTSDILRREGLGPEFKVDFEGTEIGLSKAFDAGFGYKAAIGYVKADDGYKVRGYYRSKSSGMWRYLPDCVVRDGRIVLYGKGRAEESLNLPPKMQEALDGVLDQEEAVVADNKKQFLLGGTAKRYNSEGEYRMKRLTGALRGDLYKEVDSRPTIEFSSMMEDGWRPEDVRVDNPEQEPDFSKLVAEYSTESEIYGHLKSRCVKSRDGILTYTFMKDEQGRAFVGGIDIASEITSTGLRKHWVHGGDLETPLYEYSSQAHGFGDINDRRGGYVGMWRKYLSKIPMIRRFLESGL